jgi:hypothetical protein
VKELPGYPVQNSSTWELPFLRGGCRQGRNSIWFCVNGMPQKETLDKAAYTCLLVSYRRLSAQFQFSLSADTLGYLSQWSHLPSSPPVTKPNPFDSNQQPGLLSLAGPTSGCGCSSFVAIPCCSLVVARCACCIQP